MEKQHIEMHAQCGQRRRFRGLVDYFISRLRLYRKAKMVILLLALPMTRFLIFKKLYKNKYNQFTTNLTILKKVWILKK